MDEASSSYLHIGMVDEGPSSGSLQNIVEEVLQPPVESVAFGGFLASGDAAALPPGAFLPPWTQQRCTYSIYSILYDGLDLWLPQLQLKYRRCLVELKHHSFSHIGSGSNL